jgi:hypothetical protein
MHRETPLNINLNINERQDCKRGTVSVCGWGTSGRRANGDSGQGIWLDAKYL